MNLAARAFHAERDARRGLVPVPRVVEDAAAALARRHATDVQVKALRRRLSVWHADAMRPELEWRRKTARVAERDNLSELSADTTVRQWARRRACEAQVIAAGGADEWEAFCALQNYLLRWHVGETYIQGPKVPREGSMQPYIVRATCWRWWTRAARRMLARGIEAAQVDKGRVHRHAGLYVSDQNAERVKAQDKRNADALREMEVFCEETGQRANLAEVAEGSTSNPWVRFSEMMVRAKGLDALAKEGGWIGWFITWTLPSRWHARHWHDGAQNDTFYLDGDALLANKRAKKANSRLVKLWSLIRGRLSPKKNRPGVPFFGMRVSEPHHDGTPHWHLMLWLKREDSWPVLRMMKRLALHESPDERGARKRRFNVKRMREEKGSAAGYLMKYLVKNTTGAGLGSATDQAPDGEHVAVREAPISAQRARAWASVHGIRQWQTYGTPPVGIWRELRRVRAPLTIAEIPQAESSQLELFERARAAADASDYAAHVRALGGIAVGRAGCALALLKREDEEPNRYGEARPDRTVGVRLASSDVIAVVTRLHRWEIRWARESSKGSDSAPWTRGNNCNGPAAAPDRAADFDVVSELSKRARRIDPDVLPDWWARAINPAVPIEGRDDERREFRAG